MERIPGHSFTSWTSALRCQVFRLPKSQERIVGFGVVLGGDATQLPKQVLGRTREEEGPPTILRCSGCMGNYFCDYLAYDSTWNECLLVAVIWWYLGLLELAWARPRSCLGSARWSKTHSTKSWVNITYCRVFITELPIQSHTSA